MKNIILTTFSLLSLLVVPSVNAQTYVERTGAANPFSAFNVFSGSTPVFVNFDGDADLDVVIGDGGGKFWYYRNDGGTYTAIRGTDAASPFNWLDTGTESAPTFVDVDGDSDLDLVAGDGWTGTFKYYNNVAGVFTEKTGNDNPFDGLTVTKNAAPTFVDVDGDSDLDLVSGNDNGDFAYFQNNAGVYTEVTGSANPFNGLNSGGRSRPFFVDVDKDNDLDLVSGETWNGSFVYYENVAGVYTQVTGASNPFDGLTSNSGFYSAPTFADVDGDTDLDLISGDNNGKISYFENTAPIVTAVQDTAKQKVLTVYPNPTEGLVTVENGIYEVYSLVGAKLLEVNVLNKVLDLSSLSAGQYLLKSGASCTRVVKN